MSHCKYQSAGVRNRETAHGSGYPRRTAATLVLTVERYGPTTGDTDPSGRGPVGNEKRGKFGAARQGAGEKA